MSMELCKIYEKAPQNPLENALKEAYQYWQEFALSYQNALLRHPLRRKIFEAQKAGLRSMDYSSRRAVWLLGNKWDYYMGVYPPTGVSEFEIFDHHRDSHHPFYRISFTSQTEERAVYVLKLIHQARCPQRRVVGTEIRFHSGSIFDISQQVKNNTYFTTPFPDNKPRAEQSAFIYHDYDNLWHMGIGVYLRNPYNRWRCFKNGGGKYDRSLIIDGKPYKLKLPSMGDEEIMQALKKIQQFEPAICFQNDTPGVES